MPEIEDTPAHVAAEDLWPIWSSDLDRMAEARGVSRATLRDDEPAHSAQAHQFLGSRILRQGSHLRSASTYQRCAAHMTLGEAATIARIHGPI